MSLTELVEIPPEIGAKRCRDRGRPEGMCHGQPASCIFAEPRKRASLRTSLMHQAS